MDVSLSSKNKDISSYMKLQLNNIMVLLTTNSVISLSWPKTNYPVSLYNTMITYLYNSTSPENYRSIIMTARFFYGDKCLEYNSVIHHKKF